MAFTSVKVIVLIQVLALVVGSFSKLSFGEFIENWSLDNHEDNEIISTKGFFKPPKKSTPSTHTPVKRPSPSPSPPAKSSPPPSPPAKSPPPPPSSPPPPAKSPPPPTQSPPPPSSLPPTKSPPPAQSPPPPLTKQPPAQSPRQTPPPSPTAQPPANQRAPPPSQPPKLAPPVGHEPPPVGHEPPIIVPPPFNQPRIIPFPPTVGPPFIPRITPPVKLPLPEIHPPGKPLIVVGRVNCKSCSSRGLPSLFKASPLEGSSVKLVCHNNGRKANVQSALTDRNGDFAIIPISLTRTDVHKCRVYLIKSPKHICNVATNYNNGKSGAVLKPILPPRPPGNPGPGPVKPPIFDFFGVGPFIFQAQNKFPCIK